MTRGRVTWYNNTRGCTAAYVQRIGPRLFFVAVQHTFKVVIWHSAFSDHCKDINPFSFRQIYFKNWTKFFLS